MIGSQNLVSLGQPFFWDIKVAGAGYRRPLRARLTARISRRFVYIVAKKAIFS